MRYFFQLLILLQSFYLSGYAGSDPILLKTKDGKYSATFFRSADLLAVRSESLSETDKIEGMACSSRVGDYSVIRRNATSSSDADQLIRGLQASLERASGLTRVFFSSANDRTPFIPTGRIHLKFMSDVSSQACTEIITRHNLSINKTIRAMEFFVKMENQGDAMDVSMALQELDSVAIAIPELVTPAMTCGFSMPTDSLMCDQWHLQNTGKHRGTEVGLRQGADARVLAAWKVLGNLGSSEIKIAVIDDGFDLAHPDLSLKVQAPRDFGRGGEEPLPDYDKKNWHGTAVAGIALGADNGGKIIGVSPRARMIPIRWTGKFSDDDIEQWFDWAIESGADIINCSWAPVAKEFKLSDYMTGKISQAAITGRNGKGCVVIFAAENEGKDIGGKDGEFFNGFANHPDVIAVSASTSIDTRSSYSNHGKNISVCAPSSGMIGILTCDVRGVGKGYNGSDIKNDGYHYNFGGTSAAAPIVSGVAALILSANPDLTGKEVKEILQRTARKIGTESYDSNGHSIYYGYGCVDAKAAVEESIKIKQLKEAEKKTVVVATPVLVVTPKATVNNAFKTREESCCC